MENNNQYDISIITPTLNAARFIKGCLESVNCQSNINVQHIVVDGGSTDDTYAIAARYDVLFLERKGASIYEALNFGIQNATAPILGFINADDRYIDHAVLQSVVDSFRTISNKGVIYGNCLFVNDVGRLLYRLAPSSKINLAIAKLRVFNVSHPSWYIDYESMEKLCGYDTSLKYIADCDLFIRALSIGLPFHYVNRDFAAFTLHENNASRTEDASLELRTYFEQNNGTKFYHRWMHKILLIGLYMGDLRYFLYRINRFLTQLFARQVG